MIDIAIFKNSKAIQKLFILLMIIVGFSIIIPIFLMLFGILFWSKETVMGGINSETSLSYLIYFQFFTQLFVFGGGALFFASIVSSHPFAFVGIKKTPNFQFLISSTVAIILVIPLSSWLLQASLSLSYPESWQPIIAALKQQEEVGNNLMARFLNVDGFGWLLFNLLFMAVIPAICEELLFRGALIGVLKQMIQNKHILVIVSAILFSAIHLQFFSFLSRFVLGLVLGYAFIYSSSIIPSMVAHFTNNAISVIGYYFSDRSDVASIGSVSNYWVILISTLAAIATIVWMQKIKTKHVQTTE